MDLKSLAVQLRDYIHDHLYNAECGYFNKHAAPVAPLPKPLDFASFLGKADYQKAVQQAYNTLPVRRAVQRLPRCTLSHCHCKLVAITQQPEALI